MRLEDGMRISCYIGDTFIDEALVVNEDGNLFICQDYKDGTECSNKEGYKYSWAILSGDEFDQEEESVTDVILFPCSIDKSLRLRNGMRVTCKIKGNVINDALICKQGLSFYICQNIIEGSDCEDKFNYRYSWVIGNGSVDDLKHFEISDLAAVKVDESNYRRIM